MKSQISDLEIVELLIGPHLFSFSKRFLSPLPPLSKATEQNECDMRLNRCRLYVKVPSRKPSSLSKFTIIAKKGT